MPEFKCDRPPRIVATDLKELRQLLDVFDHVTFNFGAEILAVSTIRFPLFGELDVSLFPRENHLAIFRDSEKLWSGYIDLADFGGPDDLQSFCLQQLIELTIAQKQPVMEIKCQPTRP